MSCKIELSKIYDWIIPKETIMEKYYPLLTKNKEVAGKVPVDLMKKRTGSDITYVEGDNDSVEAPHALVNYHTHPSSCYIQEKTIFGWVSAEDCRESIVSAIQGSVAHIVPAIEGTYVIQINPCILENLVHLENFIKVPKESLDYITKLGYNTMDFYRGLIITCIEIYLRASHAFRCIDFNKPVGATGTATGSNRISVNDFIKYVNSFTLSNLFSKKKVETCGRIKCGQVGVFENKKLSISTFNNYVKNYESEVNVFLCSNKGELSESKLNIMDAIKDGLLEPLKTLKLGTKCKYPKKLWTDKWFLIKLYHNKVELDGRNCLYDDLSTNDKIKFLKEHSKGNKILILEDDAKFRCFSLDGNCDHEHIKNNISSRNFSNRKGKVEEKENGNRKRKRSIKRIKGIKKKDIEKSTEKGTEKSTNLLLIGSSACHFCEELVKKLDDKKIKYIKEYHPDISSAINSAEKLHKDIDGIPALFHDNKLINNKKFIEDGIIVYEEKKTTYGFG
jgi:hypothetical protein